MNFQKDIFVFLFKSQTILELLLIFFFPKIIFMLILLYILRELFFYIFLKPIDYSSLSKNEMKIFTFLPSSNREKQFINYNENCKIMKIIRNNNVLIKLHSSSINPADIKIQKGSIPFYRWIFLINYNTIGGDFAGEVVSIGKNVTKFKVGDEVVGRTSYGVIQEYTQVNENSIVLKPKNVTFNDAASLPTAALTSYESLIYFYQNKSLEGKNILIIGASGGCGIFGVQLSKILGANFIVGVCSSKNKNFVLENGANAVIEYNKENYIEDLNKLNIKFDLIYDTIDSKSIKEDYYNIFKGYLKENEGFYISINGKGAFKTFPHIIKTLFGKENKNTKIKFFLLLYGRYVKDLEILLKYVNEGKLKPNLNIFEFDKESVQKGIDLLASHRTTGKIVFEINK